jgi:UDP-N-acetylmuramyl pentapeptide phosphotransferase/UDP-N-acetylglucosamine-1-phosphate transferase/glycosyltransferase involved in cell wall biosynthesis
LGVSATTIYAISYLSSAGLAAALTPLAIRLAAAAGIVDVPDARKVHHRPIPRSGGVAIALAALGVMLAAAWFATGGAGGAEFRRVFAVVACAAVVFAVGLADDLYNIPSRYKLLALLGASLALCAAGVRIQSLNAGGLSIDTGAWSWALTTLWILGITVSLNFIDGLDGLAAGIASLALAVLATGAWLSGDVATAAATLALLGAISGFLPYNFNPARVFMGDGGSMFIGFSLASCTVLATRATPATQSLLLPAVALAVPLVDTLLTFVRRGILERRSIFAAERGHIHHRLLDLGLQHRAAVLTLYAVSASAVALAALLAALGGPWTEIAGAALAGALVLLFFRCAGSVRGRDVLAAVRRNRSFSADRSRMRHVFEEMQLRMRKLGTFDAWWREACVAAERLGFRRMSLQFDGRDGSSRTLQWDRSGQTSTGHGHPHAGSNGNGHAQGNGNGHSNGNGHAHPHASGNGHGGNGSGHNGNGNGTGNGHAHAHAHPHGNGHGHENGNGHAPGAGYSAPVEVQTVRATIPVEDRRSCRPLSVHVELEVAGHLESAGQRLALFTRLMDERPLASVKQELGDEKANAAASPEIDNMSYRPLPGLKVAIVHDFLYCYAGAERVLEQMLAVFPDAELFSLFDFVPPEQRRFLRGKTPRTSVIQRLPFARTRHRAYLPIMPLAIEQLDVTAYDVVISSSYVAAKGVLTRPDQLHVCYCHSPVRFAWDLQNQYLAQGNLVGGLKSLAARIVLHYIRSWDVRSANGVDVFLTNSRFVGRRIQKVYRRPSTVVFPPVDVEQFALHSEKHDFYLTTSRLVPYKRVDVIVEAFARLMPDKRLVVIGEGPEMENVRAKSGPNVKILGHQSAERLRWYMQRAKAFVFAAEEDFGIVPVEAQACGTPVIAFGRGGVTETVVDGQTGVFFDAQTAESVAGAVKRFEEKSWSPAAIRENAMRFSAARFRAEFGLAVQREWITFQTARAAGTERMPALAEGSPVAAGAATAQRSRDHAAAMQSLFRLGVGSPDLPLEEALRAVSAIDPAVTFRDPA